MKSKPMPKKAAPAKSAMMPMPMQDKQWQAEDDARTLMRAEEIKADKGRASKAKAVVAKQVKAGMKITKP